MSELYGFKKNLEKVQVRSKSESAAKSHLVPTLIDGTPLAAPSTSNIFADRTIPELANWNVVVLYCKCGNANHNIVCFRGVNTQNYLIDALTSTKTRGGYYVDWANNRIRVRWLEGNASLAQSFVQIMGVYGLVQNVDVVDQDTEDEPSDEGDDIDISALTEEVLGIRIGADGTIYETAGEAVREQYNALAERLNLINAEEVMQQINDAIAAIPTEVETWLDEHPEATTTVQDGAITEAKLSSELKSKVIKDYVMPETFGAVGDGVTDDTAAIQEAIDSGKNVMFSNTSYLCGRVVIRNSNIIIDGNFATLLHGANNGFVISKDAHDVTIRNFNSICTYVKDSQQATNVHVGIGADNDLINDEYYAYNITIQNCSFNGGVIGFSATSVKNILIDNCKFNGFVYKPEDGSGGYGILLQSCVDVKIEFSEFIIGEYGRHDVYVSVDQRKTENIKCKNVTINNCKFNHSNLFLDEDGYYYSPNTVAINIRTSDKTIVENSYFYNVTGAVNFLSADGIIEGAVFKNNMIDTPVYNAGGSETRYIVNFNGLSSDDYITADISGITLLNVPNEYTSFISLKHCKVNVYGCNIARTNIVCYQNVVLNIRDIITTFTSYFIRFSGGDETKGSCRNITFLNNILSPSKYYFSTGSSAANGFYDTVQMRIQLADSATFTDWKPLPDGMNPQKCFCSGIGLIHSTGIRFGQGTNSASARIFVELGTDGIRVYNSDSNYFSTNAYVSITPILTN